MQTFLPYPSFARSARCLDNKRLNNQRNEAEVILKTLLGYYEKGWPHHPAVKMWRGHERALCEYALAVCAEVDRRGLNQPPEKAPWFEAERTKLDDTGKPGWVGRRAFHASHRSNLLRKNPEHYAQFNWKVRDDLAYVWPA